MLVEGLFSMYAGKLFNDTSKQMFVKIWDILNEKHDDLKELIKSIDLDSRVELIESVIRDISDDMKIHNISPNHSLELALSAEIVATNDDIVAINDSIDSLETALAGATTYVEQVVTGVTSGKTFSITTPVLFAADKDLEVFVNGLKVPFTTFNGITFNIVADYDLEGTDKVTVLGIEA